MLLPFEEMMWSLTTTIPVTNQTQGGGLAQRQVLRRYMPTQYVRKYRYLFKLEVVYKSVKELTIHQDVQYRFKEVKPISIQFIHDKEFSIVQPVVYTTVKVKEGKIDLTHDRLKKYLELIFS